MENLHTRFDVLQDVLFQHIEQGSHKLSDHKLYWEARRRESALLHYARQNNIPRLGFLPVPSLAATENQAKTAIKMTLILSSLQNSPFAEEPWTMTETSNEMFVAPPADCFKKGGYTVDVHFDNDPNNAFPYTCWDYIYYQKLDGTWGKARGQVDYEGLSYTQDDGEQIYFARFHKDAMRYGTTGKWKVLCKNAIICPSVSSSGSTFHQPPDNTWRGPECTVTSSSSESATASSSHQCSVVDGGGRGSQQARQGEVPAEQGQRERGRGRGRGRGSPPSSSPSSSPLCVSCDLPRSPQRQQSRERQEEEEEERPGPSAAHWEAGGEGTSGSRRWSGARGKSSKRGFRGRGQGEHLTPPTPRLQPSIFSPGDFRGRAHPPRLSPANLNGQVGSRPRRPGGESSPGPGEASTSGGGVPVILLTGAQNPLKCYRLRLWKRFSHRIECISKGFAWTHRGGKTGDGHRLLIGFKDEGHRAAFLKEAKIPKPFDVSLGYLGCL